MFQISFTILVTMTELFTYFVYAGLVWVLRWSSSLKVSRETGRPGVDETTKEGTPEQRRHQRGKHTPHTWPCAPETCQECRLTGNIVVNKQPALNKMWFQRVGQPVWRAGIQTVARPSHLQQSAQEVVTSKQERMLSHELQITFNLTLLVWW